MDDLFYWLALHLAPGVGPATFHQLLQAYPDLRELFANPDSLKHTSLPASTQKRLSDYLKKAEWKQVEQTLLWSEAAENNIITMLHPTYPSLLKQIDKPPAVLFVKGRHELLSQVQLAMVGSRNPSVDGAETAFEFARLLAAKGMIITSGMALGIDAQCHAGALSAQGSSIAVMGTGLDRIYPARHKKLAYQLAEQGAIISEYPLGSGPSAGHFPQRNRIISGLSVGTLVIEAALQSGSLITARQALEQGREIFAIPGSIHNPLSRGCHQLIREGAKLVETADDILEELSSLMLASQLTLDTQQDTGVDKPFKQTVIDPLLPKIQQKILSNIGYTPVSVDHLATRTGLGIAELNANLVLLEVNGLIQSQSGFGYTLKKNQ